MSLRKRETVHFGLMPTSSYMPAPLRQPFAYVPHGVLAEPKGSAMNLGEAGQRRAEFGIPRPHTAPAAHPKPLVPYPLALPGRTGLAPDRLFDDGIKFPRGDIGPQMFPKDQPKADGDRWAAKTRSVYVREVGTKPHNSLRAFRSSRSDIIMYQMSVPPPRYGI